MKHSLLRLLVFFLLKLPNPFLIHIQMWSFRPEILNKKYLARIPRELLGLAVSNVIFAGINFLINVSKIIFIVSQNYCKGLQKQNSTG